MKPISFKKILIPLFHVAFWFVSFNFWNVILNPGVESVTVIQGIEVEWNFILLANTIFLLYCAIPFVWLVKRRILWLKILCSFLFLVPIGIALINLIRPFENQDEITSIVDFFVRNFLYVVLFHLPIVFAVYFNANFLIKKYLNQNHFSSYLGIILGLCIATALLDFSVFNFVVDKIFPGLYYISYFKIGELILIIAGYILFTSFLYLVWQYAQMLVERKEAAQNELLSLKAQINPHFLFNNLNTIYSMASQNDERTSETVLKLSDFLRYILYDTAGETIPLQKEVEIIETYISLQKERINSEMTSVEFKTKGDFSEVKIAPLLLLPLVENCFKHGIGKSKGEIKIDIEFDDKHLRFRTFNTVALRETSNGNGGIGIVNVEKRLNLIYPDRHSIEFQEKDGGFRLEMKIHLT